MIIRRVFVSLAANSPQKNMCEELAVVPCNYSETTCHLVNENQEKTALDSSLDLLHVHITLVRVSRSVLERAR